MRSLNGSILLLGLSLAGCTMEPEYLGWDFEEVQEDVSTEPEPEPESSAGPESGGDSSSKPRPKSDRKRCKHMARRIYGECRRDCEKDDHACHDRCRRVAGEFLRECIRDKHKDAFAQT